MSRSSPVTPWRRRRRPTSDASGSSTSRSLIGGGEPSTSGREPGIWPRACAFGPRTSPSTRSSAPSSRSSQSTSTTAGSSDTTEKLGQDLVELFGALDVDEVASAGDLSYVEFLQLPGGDE